VIYVFVFHWPEIRQTTDMIKRLGIFNHCRPLRPAIQKCALKYCGPFSINESVADLHAVFKLAPDFSTAGLPEFQQLIPGPERDPFYKAALDIKRRLPDDAFPIVSSPLMTSSLPMGLRNVNCHFETLGLTAALRSLQRARLACSSRAAAPERSAYREYGSCYVRQMFSGCRTRNRVSSDNKI
jgi:hypothetical protein